MRGEGGRGAATTLLSPVQPPLMFRLHWLKLGGESLLKAAEARGDLIVKLGPRSVTG